MGSLLFCLFACSLRPRVMSKFPLILPMHLFTLLLEQEDSVCVGVQSSAENFQL